MSQQDYFLILDYETTGLPDEKILEVAWMLTNTDLDSRAEGKSLVIGQKEITLNKDVLTMHVNNGLLQEVAQSTTTVAEAEQDILQSLGSFSENRVMLMGFTCHYDRHIMARDMPKLHERLHFRHFDMSVPRGMYHYWCENLPKSTQRNHRALDDVLAVYKIALTFRDLFQQLPKNLQEKGLSI